MIFLISLVTALYCSCLPVPEITLQENPPKQEVIQYSSRLCEGDRLQFGNKAIQFKKVVSDSRCPKGTTCIWAGEVKVLVEFFENGQSLGEEVINGANFNLAQIFGKKSWNLNGFQVSPYPSIHYKIEPEEYSLSLNISETIVEEN